MPQPAFRRCSADPARARRPDGWPPVARGAPLRSGRRTPPAMSRATRPVGFGSMGLKIAVVGGGSTYTPELVEGFAHHADRLRVDELVLLDPDPERLEVVGGLAGRIL